MIFCPPPSVARPFHAAPAIALGWSCGFGTCTHLPWALSSSRVVSSIEMGERGLARCATVRTATGQKVEKHWKNRRRHGSRGRRRSRWSVWFGEAFVCIVEKNVKSGFSKTFRACGGLASPHTPLCPVGLPLEQSIQLTVFFRLVKFQLPT